MSLADWIVKDRGVWGQSEARLAHNHEQNQDIWFFCCKDGEGWYCRKCKERAPKEMAWAAKLAGAMPTDQWGF